MKHITTRYCEAPTSSAGKNSDDMYGYYNRLLIVIARYEAMTVGYVFLGPIKTLLD